MTVTVAVVNDYDLVVAGVACLLGDQEGIKVVDTKAGGNGRVGTRVDVALFDTFGRVRLASEALGWLCSHEMVDKVAVASNCNIAKVLRACTAGDASGVNRVAKSS